MRPRFGFGREQVIQILGDFALDPCLERPHQKTEFGLEFEFILGHRQAALNTRTDKGHFVGAVAFFISAAHAKFLFGVFSPFEGHFTGTHQPERVVPQNMKISH